MDPTLRVICAALAVYRVSHMLAVEEGPGVGSRTKHPTGIFMRWRNYLVVREGQNPTWVSRGFACVLCISFWAAFPAAAAVQWPFWLSDYVLLALALSAVATLLKKYYFLQ